MTTSTSSPPGGADESCTRQPQRPKPGDFHIALFCALPLEADAVDAMFDEHWDDYQNSLSTKAAGDVNAYTFGRIGRHRVVLVHLAAMGKVHSAAAAAQCRNSFPNIELALVVGICGVAPYTPDKEEIVLGDVIISDGVVQYDLGRQFPTRFIRKDTLYDVLGRPNLQIRSLLAKLKVLRVREELDSKAVHCLERLRRKPKLCAQYPGVEHDKLFESTYRHIGDSGSCEDVECMGTLLTRHRLEPALKYCPTAHLGLIASGDTVMKSAELRDNIAKETDAIAFEMESAGVWDNFPCIVIKGACDYADSHKSKRWQRYAAATAAAYMSALLDYWVPSSKAGV
jgi:nucleoside phosphorylase